MQIHEAPHGINLVIETPKTIYSGRFDNTGGFQVLMLILGDIPRD